MTDNPNISSASESSDIDIGAARAAFTERIERIKTGGRWGNVTEVDQVLIRAVTELYGLLEHETRRIDNELTQEVKGRGDP